MTKLINKSKLTTFTSRLWDKISNSFVSKTQENLVEGKTILQDGYIDGVLYSVNNPNATDDNYTRSNTVYSGTSNRTIPAGQQVTTIVIGLRSSVAVGSTVTGINVGVVRKSDNTIIEYLHRNSTSIVLENKYTQINSTRIVNVNINKKWNEEIYFIVGANGMVWQEPHRDTGLTAVTGGDNLRPVGSVINNLNRTNYIGKIVVLGKAIKLETLNNKVDLSDVANVANKIPRIGENGKLDPSILPAEQNGGVRTVNDQSPNQNGNVIVLAEHIKYANGQDTTVKGAIDNKPNTVNGQSVNRSNGNITIYSDNININSSTNQTIKQALDERVHKNQENTFTQRNTFNSYSPRVSRVFTRKHINSSVIENPDGFEVNKYFAAVNEKYTEHNKVISHVLLPIKNSRVGDNVSIDYFIFNNNGQVTSVASGARQYPVIDEQIAGCYCAKININTNSGTAGIGFGFMLFTHTIDGRQLQVACKRNVGSNNGWTRQYKPNVNDNLAHNTSINFTYKICYETTSELVTRFELENVTQMYPRNLIGEMKQLAYDGGNSLDDGTNTWLKANGQAINSNDYPELYEKFNTSRTDDDIEVSIPSIDSQAGYYYICAK